MVTYLLIYLWIGFFWRVYISWLSWKHIKNLPEDDEDVLLYGKDYLFKLMLGYYIITYPIWIIDIIGIITCFIMKGKK